MSTVEKKPQVYRINPENRLVSPNDPSYVQAWTEAMERLRAEIEIELRKAVEKGEIEIPVVVPEPGKTVGVSDAMQATPESAIHFRAHSMAEEQMQDWAVKRGIGLVGMSGGWDHGQEIKYIDDPAVPFMEYQLEEVA